MAGCKHTLVLQADQVQLSPKLRARGAQGRGCWVAEYQMARGTAGKYVRVGSRSDSSVLAWCCHLDRSPSQHTLISQLLRQACINFSPVPIRAPFVCTGIAIVRVFPQRKRRGNGRRLLCLGGFPYSVRFELVRRWFRLTANGRGKKHEKFPRNLVLHIMLATFHFLQIASHCNMV